MENERLSNPSPQISFAEGNNQSEPPTANHRLYLDNRVEHRQSNQWQLKTQLLTEIKGELGIRTPTYGVTALREILYKVQSQRGIIRQLIEQVRRQSAASTGQMRTQQPSHSATAESPEDTV